MQNSTSSGAPIILKRALGDQNVKFNHYQWRIQAGAQHARPSNLTIHYVFNTALYHNASKYGSDSMREQLKL